MYITTKVAKQTSLTIEQLQEISPLIEEVISKLLPQLMFERIEIIEDIKIDVMQVDLGTAEPEKGFFITVKAIPEEPYDETDY